MKKLYIISIVLLALSPFIISFIILSSENKEAIKSAYEEKVYVALEAEGRVAVIDSISKKVIQSIDLSETIGSKFVKYTAHNIQVSPNGKRILVTANVDRGVMGNPNAKEDLSDGLLDKIFIIDPLTDTVIDSISVGIDTHLAHIVVNLAGDIAYVSLQEKGKVYVIDLIQKKIAGEFELGEKGEPHGLRMLPDGSKIFVALLGKKSMSSINIKTGEIANYPFSGAVVQTAVTPDNTYAFATVYDTKKIAWVNVQTNEQGYIDLPSDAKGPVQIYPTPDSRYVYVADQGYYFKQPTGTKVYRISVREKVVDQVIDAGSAPHGVVVNKMGTFVYVTNLLSEDVSIIDTASGKEVTRISVGKMPNGISIWNKKLGGTP